MTKTSAEREPRLLRNDTDRQYEVWLGDTRAGVATFRETAARITFMHTAVNSAFGGQGLGSMLAAFALQDTVDRGKRIVAVCPFITEYLSSHHEFDEHLDETKSVRS